MTNIFTKIQQNYQNFALSKRKPRKTFVKYNQKCHYIQLTPRCMYYYMCTQLLSWGPIRDHYWATHLTSPRGKMNSSNYTAGDNYTRIKQSGQYVLCVCVHYYYCCYCLDMSLSKTKSQSFSQKYDILRHLVNNWSIFSCLLCYKFCCCHNK